MTDIADCGAPWVTCCERRDEQNELFKRQAHIGNNDAKELICVAEALSSRDAGQRRSCGWQMFGWYDMQHLTKSRHGRNLCSQDWIAENGTQATRRWPAVTSQLRACLVMTMRSCEVADAFRVQSGPRTNCART